MELFYVPEIDDYKRSLLSDDSPTSMLMLFSFGFNTKEGFMDRVSAFFASSDESKLRSYLTYLGLYPKVMVEVTSIDILYRILEERSVELPLTNMEIGTIKRVMGEFEPEKPNKPKDLRLFYFDGVREAFQTLYNMSEITSDQTILDLTASIQTMCCKDSVKTLTDLTSMYSTLKVFDYGAGNTVETYVAENPMVGQAHPVKNMYEALYHCWYKWPDLSDTFCAFSSAEKEILNEFFDDSDRKPPGKVYR